MDFVFSVLSEIRCFNTADVAFLLDSSGSIRDEDWELLINFVKQVVGSLLISEQDIHVAAVRYSTNARVQFGLDASYVTSEIQRRLDSIEKRDGQTNLREAIQITASQVFSGPRNGDRTDAPDVMVIISDGRTDDRPETIITANQARADNIEIIPVGIDIDGDMELLKAIASNPDDVDRLRVTSYRELSQRINSLVNIICPDPAPPGTSSSLFYLKHLCCIS